MKRSCLGAAFAALLIPSFVLATTWRVEPDGSGDAPTIQGAIDLAVGGDTILLAPGVFTGVGNKNVSFGGKDVLVTSEAGAAATTIDCEDSGRAFIFFQSETSAATIAELTIRNGSPGDPGGAIYCVSASPTVTGCVFEDNHGVGGNTGGGGAIFCTAGDITIHDCEFRENSVLGQDGVGGAVAIAFASATITECSFEDNRTPQTSGSVGGAVSTWFAETISVSDCTFLRNTTGAGGGGIGVLGGTFAQVVDCEFEENESSDGGGGLDVASPSVVTDCSFRNNHGELGGGMASTSHGGVLARCEFEGNSASHSGGGLWISAATTVEDCIFVNNQADLAGGGAIGWITTVEFMNCTFYGNESPDGSALSAHSANLIITNCILSFGSGPPVTCDNPSSATAQCTDAFGNPGGDWVACLAGQDALDGNFSADPLFCNSAGGDLSLQPESPCAPPGVTGCGLVGALPVGCTPVSIQPTSWAGVKSMYRVGR
jgi:hypothetical protein